MSAQCPRRGSALQAIEDGENSGVLALEYGGGDMMGMMLGSVSLARGSHLADVETEAQGWYDAEFGREPWHRRSGSGMLTVS